MTDLATAIAASPQPGARLPQALSENRNAENAPLPEQLKVGTLPQTLLSVSFGKHQAGNALTPHWMLKAWCPDCQVAAHDLVLLCNRQPASGHVGAKL